MLELKFELTSEDDKEVAQRLKEMEGIDPKNRKKDNYSSKILYLKIFWAEDAAFMAKPKIDDNILNEAWEQEMT